MEDYSQRERVTSEGGKERNERRVLLVKADTRRTCGSIEAILRWVEQIQPQSL